MMTIARRNWPGLLMFGGLAPAAAAVLLQSRAPDRDIV
jgi:hypothetical protein